MSLTGIINHHHHHQEFTQLSLPVLTTFTSINTETTFRRAHTASEEGDYRDDDDEEEEDDEEDEDMFERDDFDLFDEKVRPRTKPTCFQPAAATLAHPKCPVQFQTLPPDSMEAEKLELMKMRTLERRAKTSELQRLRKAQVGVQTSHLADGPAAPPDQFLP